MPLPPPPPPPFLDENIIREILSWLPAETLIKFKSVCKSWKSLVSHPQFVKLHLHRSYAKNANFTYIRFMFKCDVKASYCSVSSLLEQKVLHEHPLRRNYYLFGTCNGLISLKENVAGRRRCYQVRLWNPTTRLMSQKSPPLDESEDYFNFGFGYDYVSDTYKVIAVGTQMVKVHNIGSDCWRSIQSFLPPTRRPPCWRRGKDGVYLKGTLNWIERQNNDYYINAFDLGDEKCSQLSLPYGYDYDKHGIPSLVILKDCLCVCPAYDDQVIVWQMKQFGVHESWTQLFNIPNIHLNMIPLYMYENDDVLLLSNRILYLWNHRENIRACFRTPAHFFGLDDSVKTYIESLVSPY